MSKSTRGPVFDKGQQKRKTASASGVRPRPLDDGRAFLPDPREGPAETSDELAESLAEEFLTSATSAEEASANVRDQIVPEEIGGPFLEASADEEFDETPDPSNPPDADVEPFPTAVRAPRS